MATGGRAATGAASSTTSWPTTCASAPSKACRPAAPGQEIWRELEVANDDIRIFKNRYSALIPGSSGLERMLRSLGIDTLLIAGTKTNVCCESTARDAMMLDFNVVMVSDAWRRCRTTNTAPRSRPSSSNSATC
jgi:nicotinamidase-related amidase